MSDSEPFLHEIMAAPDDDAPRLIYADWLEERGDPRGEFIRIQCELAKSPVQPSRLDPLEKDYVHDGPAELRIREAELLRDHWREWMGSARGLCTKWTFHRGFMVFVEINSDRFVEHAGRLFAEHPIRAVSIHGFYGGADKVANCPELARLTGLSLGPNRMDADDFRLLLDCEHFPTLTRLVLLQNHLRDQHAILLAKTGRLGQLHELNLTTNDIRNDGIEAIVNASTFMNLRALHLNNNSIRLLGARAIAESPYLQHLQYLDLRNNPIPRRGIDVIRARFGRNVCDT